MKREATLFAIAAVVMIFLFHYALHWTGIIHIIYSKNLLDPRPKSWTVNQTIDLNALALSRISGLSPLTDNVETGPLSSGHLSSVAGAFSPPSNQLPDRETFKKNWHGHCSYPSYISQKVQEQPWFPRYLYHLQRVDLSTSSKGRRPKNCARWWYSTPQITYNEVPHRQIGWKPSPPPANLTRPRCADFGQKIVQPTKCSKAHKVLWQYFKKHGVLYFPRSGAELGVLRESSYLTTDGDVDIFVDMPQAKLIKKLLKVLKPPPYTSGNLKKINAETHWRVRGCPVVHMVFNDWMADEMAADFGRPNHDVTCECMMNSIKMTCHKKARYRMYLQYGPSWRVPLHAKNLDMPTIARRSNIASKLKKMASKDGIVYEEAVRALDETVKYGAEEMEMILAQLNVLKELFDYQGRTRNYNFV